MADRTENDALIELAQSDAARLEQVLDTNVLHSVVLPHGHTHHLVDLERFQNQPRRKRERVELHEADSFADYVVRHRVEAITTLYADLDSQSIVAVLNDSEGGIGQPGWGDHRATLKLRKTEPWDHWTGLDGKPLTQEQFAEHIEKGLEEAKSRLGAAASVAAPAVVTTSAPDEVAGETPA